MLKQYNPEAAREQAQQLWQEHAIYQFQGGLTRPAYIIDTPPPTVSGSLHIGHIFSYTHQDIIARHRRMMGDDVLYPFGFDDNGLPTERFVEKKLGISPLQIGRSAFVREIIAQTEIVRGQFQDLWTRLGLSVDWSACYSTIDTRTQRISQTSFVRLYAQGDVYRADRPAHYCTTCYTSVAQAELEDHEQPTRFIQLAFAAIDAAQGQIVIATTRPEFLASCCAVLVHPEDTRYAHWVGTRVQVPLYGHEVPVIADSDVKPDKGTGAVMCCAFGDQLDITWIGRHKLPYRQILQTSGRFAPDIPYIGNEKVPAARAAVIKALTEQNLIIGSQDMVHAVHVHERCKHAVEYLFLRQWFVKLTGRTDELAQVASQVAWHPAYMQVRCQEWIAHLQWDWCISRQRFYGIPFPCWHCRSCGQVLMATPEQLPVDPQETPYGKPCPHCHSTDIVPDTDVMDTWNTSSLTPYIVQELAQERAGTARTISLPLALRPQAHDIIRTWALYTMVKSWFHDQTIPWKDLMISGHVLSTANQKISKSQGNSPLDPERLLGTYGADAVRYWAGSAQLGTDTAFSENQLKIGAKLVTKLWNAFIFVHEYGVSAREVSPQDTLNQWILERVADMDERYKSAFGKFDFQGAVSSIDQFFWATWCDTYLELIKDRFFTPERYDPVLVQETRQVLYTVGFMILQRYAPFVPFVTDSIYQELYRKTHEHPSIHSTSYHEPLPLPADSVTLRERGVLLQQVIDQVRKAKSQAQVSLKTDLARLTVYGTTGQELLLRPLYATIQGAARAQELVFLPPDAQIVGPALITQESGDVVALVVLPGEQ